MMALLAAMAAFGGDGWRDANGGVVKIVGAGIGRVAGQGTGVVVSAEGLVVTAASAMLSGGDLAVALPDGRRRPAILKALDPTRGLALLSIPAGGLRPLAWAAAEPRAGSVVYTWTNAFAIAAGDEPASVQRGTIAARATLTNAVGLRKEATPGPMLLLDFAASNPNAAGGAVVNARGELVGLVGRELRDARTGAWVHYAIPAATVRQFVAEARAGKLAPLRSDPAEAKDASDPLRGIALVLDAAERTPPFVERVAPRSAAARAGVRPDDLALFVGARPVGTVAEFRAACAAIPAAEPLKLLLQRGDDLKTLEIAGAGDGR